MLSRQLYSKKYLILDGYNVINACVALKKISKNNLEDSRIYLIDKLVEYKAFTGEKVIIVFDAYAIKGKKNREESYKGIDVIFTKENQTADSYIEKLATELASDKKKLVKVVTSDWAEQQIILGSGATRVSPRELLEDISAIKDKINKKYKEDSTTSKSSIGEALDRKVLEALEQIRKQGI